MSCACGENWVVEACDLASGLVRTRWHPISLEWQTTLNGTGVANVTLKTEDVTARDIWPGLTSVYIRREGATSAEFGGIVWEVGASESGTTVVGLKSIDHYLHRRVIDTDQNWRSVSQTVIGRDLVMLAAPGGIPLDAEAEVSGQPRDRRFRSWELKNIGEAVEQLTEVIDGPDWEMAHTRSAGHWRSTMIFRDFVGADRGVVLTSDIEASAYSLSISAEDLATHVWAVGTGEEEDQLVSKAVDTAGIYPRFDATPAWKDVSQPSTLRSHALGYLETNREPDARPTLTVVGLTPDPDDLRVGDIIGVSTGLGPITYRGQARILSISWTLGPESPEMRTLELVPLTRASESILNQPPAEPLCENC